MGVLRPRPRPRLRPHPRPRPRPRLGDLALIAVALALIPADPALAQSLDPVATMFNTVLKALTGPIGKAVATIAIIGVGYACYLGRMNWAWFASVLVGTVLVFFADDIVAGFA